ncbi:triphosphoribosyl-dephospho-CoA synthetase [Aquitalea magnusonii]|uniref:Probable 2-(5''-triphosphoribosyl)-3'-dephosphocoenzyme-A synthase n=1 Tax=Aquitalea magnusonii TaxID=332411 RepID=A0A3G9GFB7_9NEIS|nr:triphosphoribosyl-dephospho-CoA synthase [Aquitalea magnusonii]BBF85339.1 triphosphoribosyl-dephospho-CoA synthetase [Aquitalea magnusonii]
MQPALAPDQAGQLASQLAALACQCLLDEARLAPKPGLVDSRGSGAHQDLTLALMCRSARALQLAFLAMARAAWQQQASTTLREQLGSLGRAGEQAMLQASGGVNTHRGAIWAIGLLVAAAAMDSSQLQASAVCQRAAALAQLPDRLLPAQPRKGELACQRYGVGGARGEAQQGFPHITRLALPALQASRARGDGEVNARLNALLAIMSRLDDTCLLSRGGMPGLTLVQSGAQAVLAAGGVATLPGRRQLYQLEQDMLAQRLSPGGAADLLAATLLLDRLPGMAGN